jgi:prolyl-tRNA synthetase
MLDVYTDFAVNEAAIPVIPGRKSDSEKFAGAVASFTIEAMMKDGKALQSGTSHFLGQNFARAFDIKFLDENNQQQLAWTTSWGLSTRMVGAIVMTHGDDQGLVLPPRLAPIQLVIVPIWKTEAEKATVLEVAEQVKRRLAGVVRLKLDDRPDLSPGFKFNDWERRGVPLRMEIGPRDVAQGQVSLARRDLPGKPGKSTLPLAGLEESIPALLVTLQQGILEKATAFRDSHIWDVTSYGELQAAVEQGFARAWWCGDAACEAQVKEETKATIRCLPLAQPGGVGRCVHCGREAHQVAIFARAY